MYGVVDDGGTTVVPGVVTIDGEVAIDGLITVTCGMTSCAEQGAKPE